MFPTALPPVGNCPLCERNVKDHDYTDKQACNFVLRKIKENRQTKQTETLF